MIELPCYQFKGTAEQIGLAHGEELREPIKAFVEARFTAARRYFGEEGFRTDDPVGGLRDTGRQCLEIVREWDPPGYEEHVAIARGAGVDPVDLYTVVNYTDVRDAFMFAGSKPDSEGCTALMIPPAKTAAGRGIGAQTWDLNPEDMEFVVAIHSQPVGEPERWSLNTVGSQSLIGMNETGLCIGTTNIKTWDSRPGVGYISILHRMLRSRSLAEARTVVPEAPRSGAHTYWMLDEQAGVQFEATATSCVETPLEDKPHAFTNHCLAGEHIPREYQPPGSSSQARYRRINRMLEAGDLSPEKVRDLFRSREDGIDSICRYPEDNTGTATNTCAVFEPATRRILACRGPADRGRWIELRFSGEGQAAPS